MRTTTDLFTKRERASRRAAALNVRAMGGARRTWIALTACSAVIAVAPRAEATLGEQATSVSRDRAALAAVDRGTSTSTSARYTVHALTSGATTVREYANASGVVFAVAWNGFTHPDLDQLLGSYTAEYRTATTSAGRPHGRRARRVTTARLVVHVWGHMRSLHGLAYDPQLIPAEVTTDEIQ